MVAGVLKIVCGTRAFLAKRDREVPGNPGGANNWMMIRARDITSDLILVDAQKADLATIRPHIVARLEDKIQITEENRKI